MICLILSSTEKYVERRFYRKMAWNFHCQMPEKQISLFCFKLLYFSIWFFIIFGFHLALEINIRMSVYVGVIQRTDLVSEVVYGHHRHNGSDNDRAAKLWSELVNKREEVARILFSRQCPWTCPCKREQVRRNEENIWCSDKVISKQSAFPHFLWQVCNSLNEPLAISELHLVQSMTPIISSLANQSHFTLHGEHWCHRGFEL